MVSKETAASSYQNFWYSYNGQQTTYIQKNNGTSYLIIEANDSTPVTLKFFYWSWSWGSNIHYLVSPPTRRSQSVGSILMLLLILFFIFQDLSTLKFCKHSLFPILSTFSAWCNLLYFTGIHLIFSNCTQCM